MEMALKAVTKQDHVPVASKAAEFLRLALEIEEDLALEATARARDTKDAKYIPSDKFWKKVLKK